ncbi:MAG: UMP kinase [Gammaproteobacteria bacterium]|nr:UMP kinase [Gammaproteobacteria bacterium]
MPSGAQPARRVLLKLSGESLMGEQSFGIQQEAGVEIARRLIEVSTAGIELAVVIGGGNIFRGVSTAASGMVRATADHMGMLATVMNALALRDEIEKAGGECRAMSALGIDGIAEPFVRPRAIRHLEKGRILIFAGGIGNPYFTTDTAATVRAIDIGARALLKATKVDGVYSSDPMIDAEATRYDHLTYTDVLIKNLKVMDATAIVMCREHALPVRVFNMHPPGALLAAAKGDPIGTLVTAEERIS